eukprot:CAMPEP_0171301040 /NCGR_PEP_ID=MMETSP0816-20121228/10088_1 /TAXON_ID=420281 /ORGANISM="Proboscia inermis, Strain CCAP1064/1" /LENGTH=161 /DNA_ID=CAMNT_0011778205 /DNA_START=223 /DNA_END=708 /DNA_ORIENTATION=+
MEDILSANTIKRVGQCKPESFDTSHQSHQIMDNEKTNNEDQTYKQTVGEYNKIDALESRESLQSHQVSFEDSTRDASETLNRTLVSNSSKSPLWSRILELEKNLGMEEADIERIQSLLKKQQNNLDSMENILNSSDIDQEELDELEDALDEYETECGIFEF